jgi:hypothetical protein
VRLPRQRSKLARGVKNPFDPPKNLFQQDKHWQH